MTDEEMKALLKDIVSAEGLDAMLDALGEYDLVDPFERILDELQRLRAFKEQVCATYILEQPKPDPELPGQRIGAGPYTLVKQTLDDARALARLEALEDAAKVAVDAFKGQEWREPGGPAALEARDTAYRIAERIRALMHPSE